MRRAVRLGRVDASDEFLVQVQDRKETFSMMKTKFSTRFAMTMAIFVLAFLACPTFCADKIDIRIDIAIVVMDDHNHDQSFQVEACRKLVSYFETGKEKVRFALFAFLRWNRAWPEGPTTPSNAYKFVLMNFTGDSSVHSKVLENVTMPWRFDPGPSEYVSWSGTIEVVGRYVNMTSPPSRLKAVVVFLSYFTNTHGDQFNNSDAKDLRDQGAWIYVLTKSGANIDIDDDLVLPYANNLTANPNRTIIVGHDAQQHFDASLVDAMDKVRDGILRDTCLERPCAYKDKERRMCEAATPQVNDLKLCDPFGTKVPQCSPTDCIRECNRRWPWTKEPSCAGKCGVEVEGKRKGTVPPVMMENCPLSVTCPPCVTTAGPPSSQVGLIVGISVPLGLILVIAVVAVIVTKKGAKKPASLKGPPSLGKASKKGKDALVGGRAGKAADTSIGADMSAVSRMPSQMKGAGKSSIKDASKTTKAAKSAKSEAKSPSAKQGAGAKSPVKKKK